ncbi:MAG: hypothetical protein LBV74_06130 [Tannerella sp.]|jgi:xanthine dehydrogenase iron-sulfur cluster and FAD-binding subunit A|nr:hypothetical protein [Tannerella sp.]
MRKKKKKKRTPLEEYIKAYRKGSREAEIEQHGHPLPKHYIHVSKKIYDRSKFRKEDLRSSKTEDA